METVKLIPLQQKGKYFNNFEVEKFNASGHLKVDNRISYNGWLLRCKTISGGNDPIYSLQLITMDATDYIPYSVIRNNVFEIKY